MTNMNKEQKQSLIDRLKEVLADKTRSFGCIAQDSNGKWWHTGQEWVQGKKGFQIDCLIKDEEIKGHPVTIGRVLEMFKQQREIKGLKDMADYTRDEVEILARWDDLGFETTLDAMQDKDSDELLLFLQSIFLQ